MITDDDLVWTCQYCGVQNTVWIDLTVNGKQDIIEECRICCRPNRVIATVDQEENVLVEARPSDEKQNMLFNFRSIYMHLLIHYHS